MSFVNVEVLISNPKEPERNRKVVLEADGSFIYTIIPSSVARELGLQAVGERSLTLPTGAHCTLKVVRAMIRYGEKEVEDEVMVGGTPYRNILGAETLRKLGLRIDFEEGRVVQA